MTMRVIVHTLAAGLTEGLISEDGTSMVVNTGNNKAVTRLGTG